MVYNEKEDKVISELELTVMAGNILIGRIMQYGTSSKKLQISRKIAGRNGWQYAKLGRLTKEEIPLVLEIIEKMKGGLG